MRQKIFLSLFFIPIIILATALGVWQHQRSIWKENLLITYQKKLSQEPQILPTLVIRLRGDKQSAIGANADLFDALELIPIKISGYFLRDTSYYRPVDGGFELITAFSTDDGIIAVNAGKMPYAAKEIPISKILSDKSVTLTGFYRKAEIYGDKIPKNHSLVAKIPYAGFYNHYTNKTLSGAIQLDNRSKISDYLMGRSADYFLKNIPNNHTQYMITWFLLAIIATIIYGLLWRKIQKNI